MVSRQKKLRFTAFLLLYLTVQGATSEVSRPSHIERSRDVAVGTNTLFLDSARNDRLCLITIKAT
jgi:hypothetical protein